MYKKQQAVPSKWTTRSISENCPELMNMFLLGLPEFLQDWAFSAPVVEDFSNLDVTVDAKMPKPRSFILTYELTNVPRANVLTYNKVLSVKYIVDIEAQTANPMVFWKACFKPLDFDLVGFIIAAFYQTFGDDKRLLTREDSEDFKAADVDVGKRKREAREVFEQRKKAKLDN